MSREKASRQHESVQANLQKKVVLASRDNSTTTRQSKSQSTLAASNIKTESKLDFWTEIQTALESIIGKGENKSVVISPQSGLIIIRAYPGELRKAQEFLQSAEIIMQRQVILEAKIIEVELKDGYQQGINWAKLSSNGEVLVSQTGGGTLLDNGISRYVWQYWQSGSEQFCATGG